MVNRATGMAVCVLLAAVVATAEIVRYTGSGAIGDPTSWNPQRVPGPTDTVGVIGTDEEPLIQGNYEWGGLLLHNTASYAGFYGAGTLTLNGTSDAQYALQVGHPTEPYTDGRISSAWFEGSGPWDPNPLRIINTPSIGVGIRQVPDPTRVCVLDLLGVARVNLTGTGRVVLGEGAVGLLYMQSTSELVGGGNSELWIGAGPTGTRGWGQVIMEDVGNGSPRLEIGNVKMGGPGGGTPPSAGLIQLSRGMTHFVAQHQIDMSGDSHIVATQGIVQIGSVAPSDSGGGRVYVGTGGTLLGDGTITGNLVVDGGTLSPGHSPGLITVQGNITLLPASTTNVDILSAATGGFDQIISDGGTITLDGNLNITVLPGASVHPGDVFNFFTATGPVQGEFDHISVAGLDPSLQYSVAASGNGFALNVTPEPGLAIMFSAVVLPVLCLRPRRS